MSAFEYTALGTDGQSTRGVLEADSERQARRLLRERGLLPIAVTGSRAPQAGGEAPLLRRRGQPRLGHGQVVLLTRLLGSLLQSGLPLDDALTALARQATGRDMRRVLLDVRARIMEGQGLGASLDQFPAIFPEFYRATLKAGEQTRHLPAVLQRLADHLEQRHEIRQRVRLAMIYPSVLVAVAVLVVVGLLTYVVPEVVTVFAHGKRELPTLTRGLIAVSDFTMEHGLLLLAAALGLAVGLPALVARPRVRPRWHALLLRTPGLGALIRDSDIARFARTLGILLHSGLDIIDGLAVAGRAVMNRVIRDQLDDVAARVREGEALSKALAGAAAVPPLFVHLVASGEAAGELPKMLDTAANAAERETQLRLNMLLGLLEPALILAMGALVLVIVLAILLPIFEMNQLV